MTIEGLRRWLVFNVVGSMGVAVQLLVLVTLTEVANFAYLVATGLAVECAILHNFVWHERWTWRDRGIGMPGWAGRLLRFNLVTGTLSISANVVFTGLYAEAFGIHYAFANLMAIASCSVLNFIANDRFVFRRVQAPDACAECWQGARRSACR
ncbi:MAG: GtrA family protein [Acidobacteria bacterium]|nr:GtrA family protein [Acidobacteriota bacterium]